jgi:hypothetical protein
MIVQHCINVTTIKFQSGISTGGRKAAFSFFKALNFPKDRNPKIVIPRSVPTWFRSRELICGAGDLLFGSSKSKADPLDRTGNFWKQHQQAAVMG